MQIKWKMDKENKILDIAMNIQVRQIRLAIIIRELCSSVALLLVSIANKRANNTKMIWLNTLNIRKKGEWFNQISSKA